MLWSQRFAVRFLSYKTQSLFSSEIAVNLLKNPNNYTQKNLEQIVTSLDILKYDVIGPNSHNSAHVEIPLQVFSTQMLVLVNKTTPIQILGILKAMSALKVSNRRLWDSFESHILNNFSEAQPEDISLIIDACAYSSRKNQLLWSWFEDRISHLLDTDANFSGTNFSIIIKSFASAAQGSKSFHRRLNEKAVEKIDEMDGKEYSANISSLMHSKHLEKNILIAFIDSYEKFKFKVLGDGIATVLICFVRNDAPRDMIDDLEIRFLNEIGQMNVSSLANVASAYGKKYGAAVTTYSKKKELLMKIEEHFFHFQDNLLKRTTKERAEDLMLMMYWGLERTIGMKDKGKIRKLLNDEHAKKRFLLPAKLEMADYLIRSLRNSM